MTGRWFDLHFRYRVFTKDFEDIRSGSVVLSSHVEIVQFFRFIFLFSGVLNPPFLLVQDRQELLTLWFIMKSIVAVVDVAHMCDGLTRNGKGPGDSEGVAFKSL